MGSPEAKFKAPPTAIHTSSAETPVPSAICRTLIAAPANPAQVVSPKLRFFWSLVAISFSCILFR